MNDRDVARGLRAIHLLVTPAGTPGLSGSQDTRPGNAIPLPSYAQHWGISVGATSDADGGTYFELYRPNGGIGILKRSGQQRAKEEAKNSDNLLYQDTEVATSKTNEEILAIANELCTGHLQGKYDLIDGNCQTVANMLVERISTTRYTPRQTSSHAFGALRPDKVGIGTGPPWQQAVPFQGNGIATNLQGRWNATAKILQESVPSLDAAATAIEFSAPVVGQHTSAMMNSAWIHSQTVPMRQLYNSNKNPFGDDNLEARAAARIQNGTDLASRCGVKDSLFPNAGRKKG